MRENVQDESKQVVSDEVDSLVLLRSTAGEEQRSSGDDGNAASGQEGALDPEAGSEPCKEDDDEKLNATEGNLSDDGYGELDFPGQLRGKQLTLSREVM